MSKIIQWPLGKKGASLFDMMPTLNEEDCIDTINIPMTSIFLSHCGNLANNSDIFMNATHRRSIAKNSNYPELGVDINIINSNSLLDYCTKVFPQFFIDGNSCRIIKFLLTKEVYKRQDTEKFLFDDYSHDISWEVTQAHWMHTDSLHAINSNYTLLYNVIERGFTVILAMLLKIFDKNGQALRHLLLHLVDENETTALHHAVRVRNAKIIKVLFEFHMDANVKDAYNQTPLHLASMQNKNFDSIALFGRNSVTRWGPTSLHLAIKTRNLNIVTDLLKNFADVNIQNKDGRTPLHCAIESRIIDVIVELLRNYANADIQDKAGMTALHLAIRTMNPDIVSILLKSDINVNIRNKAGQTPLHFAIETGNVDIVENLLENNLNLNIQDNNGRTALHIAVRAGNLDIIKMVLEKSINVNIQNNVGQTALHIAFLTRNLTIFSLLLISNIDINIPDNDGLTALHLAIRISNPIILEDLLKMKANVDAQDSGGRAALHYAATNSDLICLDILIQYHANVNIQNISGQTPLHCATLENDLDVLATLLKYHTDINIEDVGGSTPLHYAFKKGNLDMIKIYELHTVRLMMAKLYVSKKNYDLVCNSSQQSSLRRIEICKVICNEEIVRMQCEKFENSHISYYEFLVGDIHDKVNVISNKNIMLGLQSEQLRKKYPLYIDVLRFRFREARYRKKLLEQTLQYLSLSIFDSLPENCINEVLRYLNTDELRRLIATIKPVTVHNQ